MMTLDRLRELLPRARWTRGKWCGPHEWVLRENSVEAYDALLAAVCEMRLPGLFYQRFGKTIYKYLNIDEYDYWIIEDCLNRRRVSDRPAEPIIPIQSRQVPR